MVLCERDGAVDGGVPHVNVSHPHDSPHTTRVSLHVAVHMYVCSVYMHVVSVYKAIHIYVHGWRI